MKTPDFAKNLTYFRYNFRQKKTGFPKEKSPKHIHPDCFGLFRFHSFSAENLLLAGVRPAGSRFLTLTAPDKNLRTECCF